MRPNLIRGLLGAVVFLGVSCGGDDGPTMPEPVASGTISLDPLTTFQTMVGWEATAEAGQWEIPIFPTFRDTVYDLAVNDLGITRLRLEIRSGAENSVDYFGQMLAGVTPRNEWRAQRYIIENDNDDPNVLDAARIHFTELDHKMDNVVLPIKQRVEANGEQLYINLNYVDFTDATYEHHDHPEEYAEFMLATFDHLQSKYGLVPDGIEVILEPDNSSWTGTAIGNVIVATASRLSAAGYNPEFIAPSNLDMGRAATFFDELILVPNALSSITEISYHRYAGVSTTNLQAIWSRAVTHNLRTAMLEHIGADYNELHDDVAIGGNSAWAQFVIAWIESDGGDSGGYYYVVDDSDPTNPIVRPGQRTKFIRQYFKFVRPGAVRIAAASGDSNLDPIAFINADGKYVVVIRTLTGVSFSVSSLPAGTYGIKYTTHAEYDINHADVVLAAGQNLTTSIPASGVITIYRK